MLLYENMHYSIRFSAALGLVEIIWHGIVTSEQLQEGLTYAMVAIREKEPVYFLADARRLSALKASDQTWIKNNLFPALSMSSVKKFARITNHDIFTQAIISNFMQLVKQEKNYLFELQSFYDRDDALEWILNDFTFSENTL